MKTEIETIKTPNSGRRIEKIIEQVLSQTCIDEIDAVSIKEILENELHEYCMILNGYYEEEYYNALLKHGLDEVPWFS